VRRGGRQESSWLSLSRSSSDVPEERASKQDFSSAGLPVFTTRHDTTRHDTTRHDTTRHDTTRHDTTRHDTTRHGTTRATLSVAFCVRARAAALPQVFPQSQAVLDEQARLVQLRALIIQVKNGSRVVGLTWSRDQVHPRGCRRLWWCAPTPPPLSPHFCFFCKQKILQTSHCANGKSGPWSRSSAFVWVGGWVGGTCPPALGQHHQRQLPVFSVWGVGKS
jgi:hypothetical protein